MWRYSCLQTISGSIQQDSWRICVQYCRELVSGFFETREGRSPSGFLKDRLGDVGRWFDRASRSWWSHGFNPASWMNRNGWLQSNEYQCNQLKWIDPIETEGSRWAGGRGGTIGLIANGSHRINWPEHWPSWRIDWFLFGLPSTGSTGSQGKRSGVAKKSFRQIAFTAMVRNSQLKQRGSAGTARKDPVFKFHLRPPTADWNASKRAAKQRRYRVKVSDFEDSSESWTSDGDADDADSDESIKNRRINTSRSNWFQNSIIFNGKSFQNSIIFYQQIILRLNHFDNKLFSNWIVLKFNHWIKID